MTTATTTSWRTTGAAEHAMLDRTGPGGDPLRFMATHFHEGAVLVTDQSGDGPVHIVGADGPADRITHTGLAVLHRDRRGGRLFHFPGADLVGTMTVARLLADSAIDEVVMVGHREPLPSDARIDTQGFLRPLFVQGRTVLVVRPAADDVVVPFEQPDPTPCCADH